MLPIHVNMSMSSGSDEPLTGDRHQPLARRIRPAPDHELTLQGTDLTRQGLKVRPNARRADRAISGNLASFSYRSRAIIHMT